MSACECVCLIVFTCAKDKTNLYFLLIFKYKFLVDTAAEEFLSPFC